jgi:hypothetical protein
MSISIKKYRTPNKLRHGSAELWDWGLVLALYVGKGLCNSIATVVKHELGNLVQQ